MQKESAIENLKAGKSILESLRLNFWLAFGTALGAYRNQDFIEGDEWDIDFGMHIQNYQYIDRIKEEFLKNGFTIRFDHQHPKGIGPEISFNRDGGHVDIFFFTPIGDKMAWTFFTNPPHIRMINNYFKNLGKLVFYDMEFNIPSPIEEYLKENYGDNWRVPIPTKDWHWDTDNKCLILPL